MTPGLDLDPPRRPAREARKRLRAVVAFLVWVMTGELEGAASVPRGAGRR